MRISDWSSDVCSSDLLVGETIDDHRCSVAAGIEAIQAVAGGGIAGTADEVSAIITDHHHVHDGAVRMRFVVAIVEQHMGALVAGIDADDAAVILLHEVVKATVGNQDRKSTRLNSSH